jgi:hypothetical protein
VLLVLVAGSLAAQTTSIITGHLLDTSGGVIQGAKVTAKSTETGAKRTVTSDAAGVYTFTVMPVGRYEIRAEATGMRPVVRRGIDLTIAATAVVDLTMELGAVNQEVTVTAAAGDVNTATAELSYLVDEKTMREIPLNGRSFTDLALLQPNVVAYPHRDGGSAVAHGLGTSINGQDPRSNVYLLDGTPMNDFTNGPAGSVAGIALGVETIREFRVETNSYSAEYGRNSGGQFNAITKSGSNDYHGSAYEFFRNDHLDARNFFDPQRIPRFTRNQFGGTLGGAIKKDRSFFFMGYEGLRERLGKTITSAVPTAEVRSSVVVDPTVRPYLNEIPLPNTARRTADGQFGDYVFSFNQVLAQHYAQGRFDQIINDNQQMYVRYTLDDADQRLPTDFPQFPRNFLSRNQFVTAEHRWVLSPRTLNSFRAGFSRTRFGQSVEANTASPLAPFINGREFPGSIDIGGMKRFGTQSSANLRVVQNTYGLEDSISLTRGKHILKAGVLGERYQDNLFNPTFSLGIYTFSNVAEFLTARPLRFIGLPFEGALDRYWRFTLMSFYLQDDWRVSSRLTLNLGARYEFSTMPRDIYGRDSALPDLAARAPTTGQLYQNPTYKNFSPRFGFAWDVLGNGKMALRGGYGVYWNTNNQQNLIVTITNPPATPRVIVSRAQGLTFPTPNLSSGTGNSIRPVQWNLQNPYVQIWNLSLQREIGYGVVATLGYAGSRGTHLLRNMDINTTTPQVLADGTIFYPAGAPRPNTAFSTIEYKKSDGKSWYNAGILEIRKRFDKGLSFQSSYTFARNIDNTQASTFFSDSNNGNASAMPEYAGFQYNKGLADFHAKHNWVMNMTYELPFKGNMLATGWQLSAINNIRSGAPLTPFVQANWSRSQWNPSIAPGTGLDRPSLRPGYTHESAVLGGPDRYLDPNAFILQPAGTLGNAGRGILIGPGLRSFDLSLTKNTPLKRLSESANMQFRVEAFNLLNHANFGIPNLIAFAGASATESPIGTFGRIQNTITSSRQIQLALRFSF